jgi:hypothetical protein
VSKNQSDYTGLPFGTEVDGGEVVVCPYCKRRGLKVFVDGVAFYNHRLGSFLVQSEQNGQYVETVQVVDESCPRDANEKKAHEEAQRE